MQLRDMILAALFAALTAVSAFIRIPLPPPLPMITLQVLVVIMAGLILRPLYAFLSQAIYLFVGLAGLPIFSEGGGFQYIFKPTFGFLIGFLFAAFVISLITHHKTYKQGFLLSLIASGIGILIIYLVGVPYGYYILNHIAGAGLTIKQTISAFCAIYLPLDLVKAVLASLLSHQIVRRIIRVSSY